MRAVLQRVSEARVTISGVVKDGIGAGLLVLVAVDPLDTAEDVEWLSGKIARLRVFPDAAGVMNLSVMEAAAELLVVSQFTLLASTRKGNRPSYSHSAPPEIAVALYEAFVHQLGRDAARPIHTGEFGAHMLVQLVNDGPVTIIMDSKLRE